VSEFGGALVFVTPLVVLMFFFVVGMDQAPHTPASVRAIRRRHALEFVVAWIILVSLGRLGRAKRRSFDR
jgi:chromate transport protein ChrA